MTPEEMNRRGFLKAVAVTVSAAVIAPAKLIRSDPNPMAWLNEIQGGILVPPPAEGELIELLRSKEAIVRAGLRLLPLPPRGRMVGVQ